jgi:hypothetical protein
MITVQVQVIILFRALSGIVAALWSGPATQTVVVLDLLASCEVKPQYWFSVTVSLSSVPHSSTGEPASTVQQPASIALSLAQTPETTMLDLAECNAGPSCQPMLSVLQRAQIKCNCLRLVFNCAAPGSRLSQHWRLGVIARQACDERTRSRKLTMCKIQV